MKGLGFFFLLLTCGFAVLPAQSPANLLDLVPDSLVENAHAVVLKETNELKILSKSRASFSYFLRAVNLDRQSPFTDFFIFCDGDVQLGSAKVVLRDLDGFVLNTYSTSAFESYPVSPEALYSDGRVYLLRLDIPCPHIVEFSYKLNLKRLLDLPPWKIQADYGVSVVQSSYRLQYPDDLPVRFFFQGDSSVVQKENEEENTFYRHVQNLPAVSKEPYAPPAAFFLKRVYFSSEHFTYSGYPFEMGNWRKFSKALFDLYRGRAELSEETRREVARLVASAGSEEEKIRLLYRYVQQNTRYVSVQLGIGGFQPFEASYVEQNKYGDCKALTNFTMSVLAEAGIKSRPVVVYHGDEPPPLSDDFARMAFNHVLLYLPEQDVWLECTSNVYPPDYVGQGNANRKGLLLDDVGGSLVDMPEQDTATNVLEIESELFLEPSGKTRIRLRERSRGMYYEPYAYGEQERAKEDMIRWFRKRSPLPAFELERYELEVSTQEPAADLQVELSVKGLGKKAGNRLLFPLLTGQPFDEVPPRLKERNLPVYYPVSYKKTERGVLHLPSGKKVESLPESKSFSSPYGSYRLQLRQEGQDICFERELLILAVELPPEEYAAWRSFLRKVAKADASKVVLLETP